MKLLAMDTSTWVLAVGVMEDGQLLGELNTNIKKNHSLRLMPAVERLLDELELAPRDLDGMAVAHGPGSYTGVRIGLTTAKTMAWGLKIPIVGISSLQVIAQNRAGFEGQIVPLLDARRKQVYTGRYTYDEDRHMVVPAVKDRIQPLDEWLDALKRSLNLCCLSVRVWMFINGRSRKRSVPRHTSLLCTNICRVEVSWPIWPGGCGKTECTTRIIMCRSICNWLRQNRNGCKKSNVYAF